MRKRIAIRDAPPSAPRPTRAAAMALASIMAIPVFILLNLIEWLFF